MKYFFKNRYFCHTCLDPQTRIWVVIYLSRMHQEAISSVIRKYLWQALRLPFFFFHLKVLKTSYFAQQTSLGRSAGGPDLLTASARWLPRQHFSPKMSLWFSKAFSILHYPLLSKLRCCYLRRLMGTKSFVYTLWGLRVSGNGHTCTFGGGGGGILRFVDQILGIDFFLFFKVIMFRIEIQA